MDLCVFYIYIYIYYLDGSERNECAYCSDLLKNDDYYYYFYGYANFCLCTLYF
jgi:hypothetical protein